MIVCLLSGFESSFSQNIVLEFPVELNKKESGLYEQSIDISDYSFRDFIAVSLKLNGKGLDTGKIIIYLSSHDSIYQLSRFQEELISDLYISQLVYLDIKEAGLLKLRYIIPEAVNIKSVKGIIRVFSPGGDKIEKSKTKKKTGVRDYSDCNCPKPEFIVRSSWGSSFGLNENIFKPPASYTDVSHLIIHHSAGTNTSSNWPGVVASIFDFHVNTNGWQDIGYNWLIDPNGIIYEGRGGGDNVRGAHMCGYNNNTMGVCILGTYTSIYPSSQSIAALKSLLAWKSCLEKIDPAGIGPITSYPGIMKHISGHKDGCSPNYTECPGNALYSLLDSLRNSIKYMTEIVCPASSSVQEKSDLVEVFPNPSYDKITFEIMTNDKPVIIKIYDLAGNTLRVINCINDKRMISDIGNFSNGAYIVKMIFRDSIVIKKLIKI